METPRPVSPTMIFLAAVGLSAIGNHGCLGPTPYLTDVFTEESDLVGDYMFGAVFELSLRDGEPGSILVSSVPGVLSVEQRSETLFEATGRRVGTTTLSIVCGRKTLFEQEVRVRVPDRVEFRRIEGASIGPIVEDGFRMARGSRGMFAVNYYAGDTRLYGSGVLRVLSGRADVFPLLADDLVIVESRGEDPSTIDLATPDLDLPDLHHTSVDAAGHELRTQPTLDGEGNYIIVRHHDAGGERLEGQLTMSWSVDGRSAGVGELAVVWDRSGGRRRMTVVAQSGTSATIETDGSSATGWSLFDFD